MRVGHHGSWCIRVFWHQVGTKPSSTIPELGIPHSLSCLTDKMVGLGLKRLHAAFYDGERLFAHHSVVRSDTTLPLRLPMRGGFSEVDRENLSPISCGLREKHAIGTAPTGLQQY